MGNLLAWRYTNVVGEGRRQDGRRWERMTWREPVCLFLLASNLMDQRTAKTLQKHQLDLDGSFVCLKRKVVVCLIELRAIVEVHYLALVSLPVGLIFTFFL